LFQALLVATLLLLAAQQASARQDSILSPSAENELKRAPVNLNPDLRRSLLRALYYLEAEYQQHQALQAGRNYHVPITGEYHKTAPAVLKDPALRRALLRVLIHLEADDLEKRSRENSAPAPQPADDAQHNTIKNYMETNFGNMARLSSAHQRAAAVLQSLENTPGPLPRVEDYFNFAVNVHNHQQPNQRRQVQRRPTQQHNYQQQYQSQQTSTPSPYQAQTSTLSPYNQQTQLPYNQQTQSPYNQQAYQQSTESAYQPQPVTQSPYQTPTQSTYSPQPVTQSPFYQQQSTQSPYQPTAQSAYQPPSAPANYQQPPSTASAYLTDQAYQSQQSTNNEQPTQTEYKQDQQPYQQQNAETTVPPTYQAEAQNYQEQQPDPTQQPQSNVQDFNYQSPNDQLRAVLPTQNYQVGQLALNFRNDDALTTISPNHNYNATTETPTTTFDYYQTVAPTDEYPTAQPNASAEYDKQVNSYIFQSPDPLDEANDNAIKPILGHELRSAESTNVAPTVETALPDTKESVPPPTQPTLTSSTTVSTTTEIEDFKIYKAPLQLAFTVHQSADGRPQKIEPLYDTPQASEEEKLKQQQYYIDEQIRTLRELQAKHRDLLKLRQQEQERLRALKKAQLAVANSAVAPTAQPQTSTASSQPVTQEQATSTSTPATTSSTTPEGNVQIHYSQGDVERQKQIQELERQQQERQRQIEEELARARKQHLLDALERERQQKLLQAENERQRQLQQAYEEQQRQRLQAAEQQRIVPSQNDPGITILRSVEFPSQPQQSLTQQKAVAPASTAAPREPSEEQKLTYRSFQQEPPPLPSFALPQTSFGTFQQSASAIQPFSSFVPTATAPVTQFQPSQFQPFQTDVSVQASIQPSIPVSTQPFSQALPQPAPPVAVATRTNRQEPFGSTGNLGFNTRFTSPNNPNPINFFTDNVNHQHRVRALDGQLQTLLHQSGISAPPEDLNIVSKVLALNHERPDQLPTFSLF